MNSKPSKNRQKISQPQKGARAPDLAARLTTYLIDLRRTTSISVAAAGLARTLLAAITRRVQLLDADGAIPGAIPDVILGATVATALTALASGMSRAEFCAWLRRTADDLDVPPVPHSAPASSGTRP